MVQMVCPNCQSTALSVVPAEVRLYRNILRTLSHPPMTPSPDILICLDCGLSEFRIPRTWLSAGWLGYRDSKSQSSDVSSVAPPHVVTATRSVVEWAGGYREGHTTSAGAQPIPITVHLSEK